MFVSCSRQVAAPPNAKDAPLANEPAPKEEQSNADRVLANQLDVLWTLKAEDAFEAAAVADQGVLYLGDSAGVFYAIDLVTGEPRWTQTFADNGFSTPAEVGAGRLYVVDFDGVVRCLTTDEGQGVWEFVTESEAYAAPRLHGGALLVTTEAGELLSLDAASGEENWRYAIEGPLRCSPRVVAGAAGDRFVLLAGCDARLTAVDPESGEEIGAVDIGGQTGSTPAVVDGLALFGTEAGEFLAVATADPASLSIVWRHHDPRRGQGIRTDAAAVPQAVVYGSEGKALYALDPTSGEPIWKKPMKTSIESSPVIAGDRVVAATTRGRLMLLDLATGNPVWEYEAGGSFVASPIVSDGRVVIGNTDGTLYCFGNKQGPANTRE